MFPGSAKLKKLGAELEKARIRQAEWTAKVKELERKYKEAENTCIHDMVHAADLTPEELAVIIRNEDGSVTQSSSTTSGTGSSSAGTAGIGNIEDLLSSLSEGITTTEEKKIGTVPTIWMSGPYR